MKKPVYVSGWRPYKNEGKIDMNCCENAVDTNDSSVVNAALSAGKNSMKMVSPTGVFLNQQMGKLDFIRGNEV